MQNLTETTLTTSSIQTGNFGQLCHAALDGQVYAQPLIVTNVTMTVNGVRTNYPSVAYVVTQNGTVYAINGTPPTSGTTCQVITQTGLLSGRYPADCHNITGGCKTISPSVAILGTPVINANPVSGQPTAGTLYAVVETQDCPGQCAVSSFQHVLYAVDISSLAVTSSVQVFPPSATTAQQKSRFSQTHIQRPGLLYANGYVFAAVSLMDGGGIPGPNGAIFQYQASHLTGAYLYFPTTPDANPAGGGVWQGEPVWQPDSMGLRVISISAREMAPSAAQVPPRAQRSAPIASSSLIPRP